MNVQDFRPHNSPLTDLEKSILDYIQNNPGANAEEVLIEFAGWEQDPVSKEKRKEAAEAIAFLYKKGGHIIWDLETGALTVREIPTKQKEG